MLLGYNLLSETFPYIKSNLIDLFRIYVYSIYIHIYIYLAIVFNYFPPDYG